LKNSKKIDIKKLKKSMNKNRTITIKSKSGITYKIDKVTKRIKVKKIKKLKDKKNINPFERKNRRTFN
jgi:hypothetical protein